MKRTAQIITKDIYLGRLLCLLLSEQGITPMLTEDAASGRETAELALIDTDAFPHALLREGDIALSRDGTPAGFRTHARRLPVPFSHRALRQLLLETPSGDAEEAMLQLNGQTARLCGEDIPLTETEAALLRMLIEADGAFVSREALLSHMSGGRGSDGSLNVYMHYIRRKLETRGERILLCSRTGGYRIDPRFLKKASEKP